jgi:4-hydroxybenzoate polyprenyltransferase
MMSNPFQSAKSVSLAEKAKAVLRLTRWREHVPYTIPLVIIGALISLHLNELEFTWRIFPVLIANILAMSFAFMINDVEDAPDDARDAHKKAHNVISSGILSYTAGVTLSATTFAVALGLYVLGGWKTFGTGGLTLVLCYLYSAHPFRLKARPVIDVVSHATMLSGLLMLSGYLIFNAYPGKAWIIILAVTLASAYGQFYNQIDDFTVDKKAGLQNTAMLLGKRMTQMVMYGCLATAVILVAISIWMGLFPSWLAGIALVIIFTLALFRWYGDMRGNAAASTGQVQIPILIGANLIALIWLVQVMGLLVIPS